MDCQPSDGRQVNAVAQELQVCGLSLRTMAFPSFMINQHGLVKLGGHEDWYNDKLDIDAFHAFLCEMVSALATKQYGGRTPSWWTDRYQGKSVSAFRAFISSKVRSQPVLGVECSFVL